MFEVPRPVFDNLCADSAEFQDFCSRRLVSLLDRTLQALQAAITARIADDASPDAALNSLLRRPPVTCPAETPLRTALATMQAEHVGSIAVTDGAGRPQGMYTLHDLLARAAAQEFSLDIPIGQVMTTPVITLASSATAHEAVLLMARHSIGHVCVVERGRLLGLRLDYGP